MTLFSLAIPALLSLLFAASAGAAVDETPATTDIRTRIARDGASDVIVVIGVDENAESARAMERAATAPSIETRHAALTARRERIAAKRAAMRGDLASADVTVTREFENLPMFTARVEAGHLNRLMRMPGVIGVYPNKLLKRAELPPNMAANILDTVAVADHAPPAKAPQPQASAAEEMQERAAADLEQPLLSSTVTYIGADRAWNRGFTGRGVAVAVIDDGLDRTHEMFAGKVVGEACFSDRGSGTDQSLCPGGATTSTAPGAASTGCGGALDVCGHGSHIAGIAAGNDTQGTQTLRGVAYEASLFPIQVFTRINSTADCDGDPAPCLRTYTSAVLSALNHVIGIAANLNIAVANLSLGGEAVVGACDNDIRRPAVDMLRSMGVLTTAAAGNDGALNRVSTPGCITNMVTVSSVVVTVPDSAANQAPNVDLLAPGVLVRSAGVNNIYQTRSGTSVAVPHVSGAIAILKAAKPTATAAEIENALKTGGIAASLSTWTWTTPRIDINAALDKLGLGGVSGIVVPGVFGSLNSSAQSYVRFFDTDQSGGTITVQIYDDVTGAKVGTWTKTVPGLGSLQFPMQTIESESSPRITPIASSAQFYSLFVDATFNGFVQHVLWDPTARSLTNISGCSNGLADNGREIGNVHTSLIQGYTSYLLVHNASDTAAKPTFAVKDSRNGLFLGNFSTTADVKPHSSALVKVSNILETLGRTPEAGQYHVNMTLLDGFTGFAQHLVDNEGADLITNMTAKCDL